MKWPLVALCCCACQPPHAAPDLGPREDQSDAGFALRLVNETITQQHRFVPGKMFGGWGPHLGHLVQADGPSGPGADLYWVDDLCAQDVPGDCDVNVNRRLGVFRRDPGGWQQLATIPLPGQIQQNTATLATGATLRSYGIDIGGEQLIECTYDTVHASSQCAPLPLLLGASANYIGAALSPAGDRVVHWTNVVDGGGGSFAYGVNYGGGWNGPRVGGIGGYNDCAYVNVGFRSDSSAWTLFGQVVTGLAPNWTFSTLVGEADLTTTDPVTWTNALQAPQGDTVASTDDLLVDPLTQDAHLLARTAAGAAAYYFRPKGGTWTGPLYLQPSSYRARLVALPAALLLVYGPNAGGLVAQVVSRRSLHAGQPVDWTQGTRQDLPVPADLGPVLGIYPVTQVYQSAMVSDLELAVVGTTRQNEIVFVGSAFGTQDGGN